MPTPNPTITEGGAKSWTFEFIVDGTRTDPSTIKLQIKTPSGSIIDDIELADMERVDTGKYRHTYSPLPEAGVYVWRVVATFGGITQAIPDETFIADESAFQ